MVCVLHAQSLITNFSNANTAFLLPVSVLGINELLISPPQPVLSRPVGGNVLLTCQPNVEKDDLITDLLWWDPRGIAIDSN